MNFRLRSLVSIGLALAFLVASLAFLSIIFSEHHYRQLEQEIARQVGMSARELLAHETERLATLAADWSLWNALGVYLRENTPGFAESEFTPAVMANLRIQAFLLCSSRHEIRFSNYVEGATRIHPLTEEALKPWEKLLHHDGPSRSGLILLGEEPWLISSQPVAEGPEGTGPYGRLIFARRADEKLAESMARLLHAPVQLIPLSQAEKLAPDVQRALLAAQLEEPMVIRGPEGQRLCAVLLPDLFGKPAMVLHIGLLRTMTTDRPLGHVAFVAASGLAGLLFAILVLAAFHQNMAARIPRVIEVLRQARQQTDGQARVTLGGAPEMVQLGAEINGLLESSSQDRIFRSLFDLMPTGILLESDQGIILDANPALCRMLGYDRSELVGQPVTLVMPPEKRPRLAAQLDRLLQGEELHHEAINVRKDGSSMRVELHERAIELGNGQRRIMACVRSIEPSSQPA